MARTPITQKVTRRRGVKKKKASCTRSSKSESTDDDWDEKIRAYRKRQASVSAILDHTLASMEKTTRICGSGKPISCWSDWFMKS